MPDDISLKIIQMNVGDLTPYIGNARTHSEQQVAQIANSMTEFGFVNPILLGKDNIIIAGQARYNAQLCAASLTVRTTRMFQLSSCAGSGLVAVS